MSPALARFSVLLLALAAYLLEISPSPALHSLSDSLTPSLAHSPSVDASNPTLTSSPLGLPLPAPTPKNPHPDSPPSSSLAANADADGVTCTGAKDDDSKSSRGMSASKKARIAVVI